MDGAVGLRGEEDEDREEEAEEGDGGEVFEERAVVPGWGGEEGPEREAGEEGGEEGDAEEDGDAGRDGGVGDRVRRHHCYRRSCGTVVAVMMMMAAADDAEEEDGHGRVQGHLQDRVHRHDERAVLDVPAREARPHKHHGDAPRQAHENEPLAQPVPIGQEGPRETEHEERGDDPVQGDGQGELGPDGAGAEGEG